MNWGYRILFTYLLFVGGIVTMAVLTFQHPLDMEKENYYEAEKEQNHRMQQREMGNAFKPLIKINQTATLLSFELPADIVEKPQLHGVLRMSRPSDAQLDNSATFDEIKAGTLSINKNKLKTGFWKYALEWSTAYGHYLIEDTLTIR